MRASTRSGTAARVSRRRSHFGKTSRSKIEQACEPPTRKSESPAASRYYDRPKKKRVREACPQGALRVLKSCLHAIDATSFQERWTWVVSLSILRPTESMPAQAKEKTRPTEMRAQMNKRAFAHTLGGEYGDDSHGSRFWVAREGRWQSQSHPEKRKAGEGLPKTAEDDPDVVRGHERFIFFFSLHARARY